MSDNIVDNYGWASSEGPNSCNYITPEIVSILNKLDVKRILDLGSGNGKLCSILAQEGYKTAGVEYDKQGVEIARSNFNDIPFYNFGVQDNPAELLEDEKPFDAVVSTEVVEHLFSPHLLPVYAKKSIKNKWLPGDNNTLSWLS